MLSGYASLGWARDRVVGGHDERLVAVEGDDGQVETLPTGRS
jgi:hypothetical protein